MEIEEMIVDFIKVCELANVHLERKDFEIEILAHGNDHRPTRLPQGYMGVYIFSNNQNNTCYKVGKVGTNSNARYQNHHYSPTSSRSNLAKSLLNDYDLNENQELQNDVGKWIRYNTTRTNILLHGRNGMLVLKLLEAFIQCKLRPKYEGYGNQIQ